MNLGLSERKNILKCDIFGSFENLTEISKKPRITRSLLIIEQAKIITEMILKFYINNEF